MAGRKEGRTLGRRENKVNGCERGIRRKIVGKE